MIAVFDHLQAVQGTSLGTPLDFLEITTTVPPPGNQEELR